MYLGRATLVLLALVVALAVLATGASTAQGTLFKWKVAGAFLEFNTEARKMTIKQAANVTLEASPLGVKTKLECKLTVPAAEIRGGFPGTSTATWEISSCKVLEPVGCIEHKVTVEKFELTSEVVEILSNGRPGHKGLLYKVKGEPKVTITECVSGPLVGTVVPDLGAGGVEAVTWKWEFIAPPIERVKTSGAVEVLPELKLWGVKAVLTTQVEAKTSTEEAWGVY